jgi:hypothetical protein
MAAKGPEMGNNSPTIGLADANPENSRVTIKTDETIQLTFFISYLPFFSFFNFGSFPLLLFPSSFFPSFLKKFTRVCGVRMTRG